MVEVPTYTVYASLILAIFSLWLVWDSERLERELHRCHRRIRELERAARAHDGLTQLFLSAHRQVSYRAQQPKDEFQ